MNKLMLFGSELKYSLKFIVVAIFEITIAMIILNIGLSLMENGTYTTRFYSKNVAGYSYVDFLGSEHMEKNTVENISKRLDITDLATIAKLGEMKDERNELFLATKPFLDNFNKLSIKKDLNKNEDYFEAYVLKELNYPLNQIVSIEYLVGQDNENTEDIDEREKKNIKIKPIGYLDDSEYHYHFFHTTISINEGFSPYSIVICDDLANHAYATIDGGAFANDKDTNYYLSKGYPARTIQSIYEARVENIKQLAAMPLALSICLISFAVASIYIMYMINVSNAGKKRSINYICGVTPKSQIIMELAKMVFVFIVPFGINMLLSVILGSTAMKEAIDNNILKVDNCLISAGVLLGVYFLSVLIGFIKYVKTKPIKEISSEQ